MKKLLTIIFSIVSFSALAAYQAGPMTTNKAAAYATTGQAPVFNGTQWVFVSTNAFGGGTATATNAIGNANGLGTNTSLFGNVGIGTTNPSHTLHVVTGTNNAVGVDSTGTDSSSMLHIHNYAGTQGPFFDFGAPPGRWGFGMSSVGSFNLRFTQDTNTDPVNGTTLVVFSTNGVITADGSGLTNIPGSGLQSPLNVSSMNVGTLTATNTFLTNGYYFHTNATTGQWGYWDTNGVHMESNFLSGVWWWRGPTNSMSGVTSTTNFQTDATSGNQTNSGTIKAAAFIGDGTGLTGVGGSGLSTIYSNGVAITTTATNINFLGMSVSNNPAGSKTFDVGQPSAYLFNMTVASQPTSTDLTNFQSSIFIGGMRGSAAEGIITNSQAGYYEVMLGLSPSNSPSAVVSVALYTNAVTTHIIAGSYLQINSMASGGGVIYLPANTRCTIRYIQGTVTQLAQSTYFRLRLIQ